MNVELRPPDATTPVDQFAQADLFDHEIAPSDCPFGLGKLSPSHPRQDQSARFSAKLHHGTTSVVSKRLFDLVFVGVFVGLFWWLYLLVFLSIKLTSPGPAVYGHVRVGLGGRKFKCYKFRSMVVNSKDVLEHLLAHDPAARAEWERTFKLKNDPRITPIGAFLRKTSLDELPQLWNIVRGEMSVVGSRPVTRKELQLYYRGSLRHYLSLRPGLTGPWQVGGRSDTTYEERVLMDRHYAETWTVWGDIKLVFATVAVILTRRGAY